MTLPAPILAAIRERQARVDELTPDQRALVHQFGWGVVSAFLNLGVTKPRQIRHLIETVQRGSVETQERFPVGTVLAPAAIRLQDVLKDLGVMGLSPSMLTQAIRRRGGVVVPMSPPDYMVEASIEALHRPRYADVRVSRWEKHKIRLSDALHKAAEVEMEPPAAAGAGA